jgi:anti-sigma B factor antagonist
VAVTDWKLEPGKADVSDLPGDRWLVTLSGDHDLSTADELRSRLEAIFQTGTTLIVDLTPVRFLDSSTLGVLLWAGEVADRSKCEHFGLVVDNDGAARRLFDLTGAGRMFDVFPTVEAAFEAFEQSSDSTTATARRWATRKQRIVKNEQAFRDYNDRRMQAEPVDASDDEETIPFVCECGDTDCIEALMITAAEFSEAHSAPNRFLVKPGHVYPDVEHVVGSYEAYAIIEKNPHLMNQDNREPQTSQ